MNSTEARKIISVKGEINLITLLLGLCTSLGAFSTWTLSNAYEAVKREFDEIKIYRERMGSRLDKLEQLNADKWEQVDSSLRDLNSKFDKITIIKIR